VNPSPPVTTFRFVVEQEDAGTRLDVFLSDQEDPPLSRSQIKKCLDAGEVQVNAATVSKAGHTLRAGDVIAWRYTSPAPLDLIAQDLPLTFLHLDEHFAIVDKPAGMVVHPAPGHPDGTLVNALLHHLAGALSPVGDAIRPGIVHRLDKDTSGSLAITRTDTGHRHLTAKFHDHDIERLYHAIVPDRGLANEGTFSTLHGRDPHDRIKFSSRVTQGKRAVTHYTVIERFPQGAALVACRLETGRTHQIRVHFADHGCPLLSDALYSDRSTKNSPLIPRHALHALTLGFVGLDGQIIRAEAPYPADFQAAVDGLRAGKNWRA
jgi:23S rRNA pseudouridine1911/1915/1917 synthase